MAIKKTPAKTKSSSLKKAAPRKAKVAPKEHIVEKKLGSIMDSASKSANSSKSKKKSNFPWWGLASLLLVLVFGTILLLEYNRDFKNNFSRMMSYTGFGMMQGGQEAEAKAPFMMKMHIVFNKDDQNMKSTIEKYLQNIEKNLTNTKVEAAWLDKNDAQGQALISKLGAKYLPIFVTDSSIQTHPKFSAFSGAVTTKNGEYVLNSEGMEYIEIPAVGDGRVLGVSPEKAKVRIIEYASMSCGYCKMMHPILQNIVKKYGRQVSLVTKNYDRGGVDTITAQAVECAADYGRFDQMLTAMYNRQAGIATAAQAEGKVEEGVYTEIKAAAKEAGVNGDRVLSCVKAGKYADRVAKQTAEAQEFGIVGTPSFFINSKFIGGAAEEAQFTKVVEEELNK